MMVRGINVGRGNYGVEGGGRMGDDKVESVTVRVRRNVYMLNEVCTEEEIGELNCLGVVWIVNVNVEISGYYEIVRGSGGAGEEG